MRIYSTKQNQFKTKEIAIGDIDVLLKSVPAGERLSVLNAVAKNNGLDEISADVPTTVESNIPITRKGILALLKAENYDPVGYDPSIKTSQPVVIIKTHNGRLGRDDWESEHTYTAIPQEISYVAEDLKSIPDLGDRAFLYTKSGMCKIELEGVKFKPWKKVKNALKDAGVNWASGIINATGKYWIPFKQLAEGNWKAYKDDFLSRYVRDGGWFAVLKGMANPSFDGIVVPGIIIPGEDDTTL